ncbi:LPXTG cell wall anchor domain-containing protein [Aeromicrobium phragmitis]|uniref:LPXTG cell wall anchor domain-containing protein n=1 Tax=Aeromicrobium phragmitis TaxID=2478914 RepID=A0A3L8PPK4_9ACTN|nr:GH92 family glycosyl hydrolase [Aeromicrobium phragmitis]RLV56759.1 LPXTG cell wall anchor domain-containing protein [Aeromicrobium phragmitis]
MPPRLRTFERPPARRRLTAIAAGALASVVPLSLLAVPPATAADLEPFDAVDLFIGTQLDTTQNKSNDAYGNTYPGAAVPFGMVQPSPTTFKRDEPNGLVQEKGGYEYTADQIRGFGMTRYSGSGCHQRFGGYEFPTIPFTGALQDGSLPSLPDTNIGDYFLDFSHDNEEAEPGYYSVTTDNGVTTELTATDRTAVSRFAFPDSGDATLVLDVSGPNNRTYGSEITIDPATNTVSGWMYGADICDNGNHYRAYFSTTYDQPFESYGTWNDGALQPGSASATKDSGGDTGVDFRHDTGGWVTFADGATVTARTGFSYVSVENAGLNRETEADGRSFEEVRGAAKERWVEALGTIDVTGGDAAERTKFYTAMYHSFLHPNIRNDVNGQYLGYDEQVHQVEEGRDFYVNFAGSGWDMYRSQAQLIALTFPEVAADIAQSIVGLTEQTGGWAPGAARMQGDNLQVIIATLDDMGITDYDRETALASMLDTQTVPATKSNRSDAYQYFSTGMIENRKRDFATSRVLEYAVDDFAIAQLAQRLGNQEAYDQFMVRAQNWMNVFDPQTQHIRPRERSGFDRNFDLRNRASDSNGDQFNQSTGYQYGWMVPHNIGTLIEKRGGVEKSMRELDVLMADLDAGAYTQTGNYLSNQPAFYTPWVYNWLQAPHETTDVLYRAVTEMYDTTPSGLPGNDDQGSLSSWYIFANLGIAPTIYGTGDLVVSAPMFEHIVIDPVGSDRVITIDAPGAGTDAKYTTGLSVNGTAQTASWVDAEFVRSGGTLDFEMSAQPGTWGTGADDVPPSHTDGADARNNVGITPDGNGNMGSMDLSDWSFSREALTAAGAAPGATIPHGDTGLEFTWPDTQPGQPDNWIPHGQRIDLGGVTAASLSFLGLSTNGPARGTAVVEYTDGSTQNVEIELTDWAVGAGGGNTELITVGYRNNVNGTSGSGTFRVFGTRPAALDASKQVAAVRLPEGSDRGIMHIFDIATSEEAWEDPDAPKGEPERVVLNPTDDPATSQHVTWRSRSPLPLDGKAEVRPVGGDVVTVEAENQPERSLDGYAVRNHSVRLDDLVPGTEYEYRVASGDNWSQWYTFETPSEDADPFTFLYFGDAQEGIGTVWHNTVDMALEAHPDAELGVYAGDLVNNASNENEWRDWFAGVAGFGDRTNVLATMGNHDTNFERWTDTFEYEANGPIASDAQEYEAEYGAHLEQVLKDSVYYTDYQGVRFITLNANRDDICPLLESGGATSGCDVGRQAWMTAQATWLDRVLRGNPHEWSVVVAHQPVFSTGISGNGLRDESDWRQYMLPVIERHNVDLVLQGHDHTYGRGFHTSTETDMSGVTAGPVYVVSNAGQKQYTLPSETDNIWTRNGAVAVKRAQDTSTYQAIRVDGDTLSYESVVTYTRPGGAATTQVGDTLDSFTITKRDDGAKWVTEQGVDVPDESVEPVNVDRPGPAEFDPETFGEVTWDDDFSTDRLGEYEAYGDRGEAAAELAVDTEAGLLTATAPGRRWSHVSLPVEAGEKFALIVEPERFLGDGSPEDSLFVGLTDGPGDRAHSWYNNSRGRGGLDVVVDGQSQGLSAGVGDRAVTWESGDRFATVVDHGEMRSWIEKDGQWEPIRSGLLPLTMSEEQIEGWAPTFSLRLDAGQMAVDRVTLLQPSEDAEPVEVVPAEVTFTDAAATENDTYTIPESTGVEYVVDDVVVATGTYPGAGEVTVNARATDGYVIAESAQTTWSFAFTDEPAEPGEPGEPGEPNEPGQPGEVVAPSAEDLTDANRGSLQLPDTVVAGETLVGRIDPRHAGSTLHGWMFSEPRALGSATVNAVGEVRYLIPSDVSPGEHRVAVAGADGAVIGWDEVTVVAPDGGPQRSGLLPGTGAQQGAALAALLALAMLAAGAVLWRRRKSA